MLNRILARFGVRLVRTFVVGKGGVGGHPSISVGMGHAGGGGSGSVTIRVKGA